MLSNLRIVLVNTFHPGNIGAAARALKNMGLSQLYLVDPREYPSEEATSRAAGAVDLLEQAVVVPTLEDAIADCQLVIGTSARTRNRHQNLPLVSLQQAAEQSIRESEHGQIAIVFGRETMGLHNDEIKQCNMHLYIDANPEYPVLNVAQAIQLVCYELRRAENLQADIRQAETDTSNLYPRQEEMTRFYEHLDRVLRQTGFIIPQHEGKVHDKLRRYFNRSRPEQTELNMLRGILASVEQTIEQLEANRQDSDRSA